MKRGPRRRGKSLASRVKPFWMAFALVATIAIVGAALAATWPGFVPKTISVSGNRIVSRADILARAGISPGTSIWVQNTRAIRSRIEAIPYVATASVHRLPPAALSIVVTERVPFAILQNGDASVLADRELRVLAPFEGTPSLTVFRLPAEIALEPGTFVSAAPALALRKTQAALLAKGIAADELGFDRYGGLEVTLHDGVRVLLGSQSDIDAKLALVQPILAQVLRGERRAASIDLRAPATPVVVYR